MTPPLELLAVLAALVAYGVQLYLIHHTRNH